jgi:hypothetical protein
MGLVLVIVVAGSSIWVAIDASHLHVAKGDLGGGLFDMGVVGWFFGVLLLWIIGFPAYLVKRPIYVAKHPLSTGSLGRPSKQAPNSGWYPDPDDPSIRRWWNGSNWGPSEPSK